VKLDGLLFMDRSIMQSKRCSVVVGSGCLINEVNRHWARLVLGWVTACGQVNHLGM